MNKPSSWFAISFFALAVAPACGSDNSGSSSSDFTAECVKVCNRNNTCLGGGDSGIHITIDCNQLCSSQSSRTTNNPSCDVNALKAKYDQCLAAADCSTFMSCQQDAAKICSNTNGAGGAFTGGAGGGSSLGAGATSGTASCDACDKAAACCTALAQASGNSSMASQCSMYSKSSCQSGSIPAVVCSGLLQGGAASGIAACQ
jgi:hypothetical protein